MVSKSPILVGAQAVYPASPGLSFANIQIFQNFLPDFLLLLF
jgi:hypothetical protein